MTNLELYGYARNGYRDGASAAPPRLSPAHRAWRIYLEAYEEGTRAEALHTLKVARELGIGAHRPEASS